MDIQMPVMDGFEATRQIRALGGTYTELPIIAMTAHALSGDCDKSLAAGMNAHVTKPINPEDVYQTLSRWISTSSKPAADGLVARKATVDALPVLPGIDVQSGLQRVRGKWHSYKKILLRFQQKHAASADEISRYLQIGELQEAAHAAHSLKGSSGNIGATEVFAAAARLDQACQAASLEQALVELGALRAKLAIVIAGLEILRTESNGDATQEPIRHGALSDKVINLS